MKLRQGDKELKKWQKEEAKEVSRHKKIAEAEMKEKNNVKEPKPKGKKQQRAKIRRADRRAKQEDAVLEWIKQACEVPQNNRATNAAISFGFGRF